METIDQLEASACRLCANIYVTAEVEFLNLFAPHKELQKELDFIGNELRAWQVKVSAGDGLPQRICANCFAQFCKISTFRQECLNAQQKLFETFATLSASEMLPQQSMTSLPTSEYMARGADTTEVILGLDASPQASPPSNLADYVMYEQNYPGAALIETDTSLLNNTLMGIKPEDLYFSTQIQPVEQLNQHVGPKNGDEMKKELGNKNLLPDDGIHKQSAATEKDDLSTDVIQFDCDAISGTEEDLKNASYDDANEQLEADDADTNDSRLAGNPLACQYCFCPVSGNIDHLIFPDSDALSQHFFDAHDPNLPYTCPYCPQKYASLKQRENHVRRMHSVAVLPQRCEFCRKELRGPVELHQYNCLFVGNWECGECSDKFPNTPLNHFRAHQRAHDMNRRHPCRVCDRVFVRRANLEAHERQHMLHAKTMTKCDQCKGVFAGDYELKRHKYQMHDGALPVKCDYCQKGFVSIAFLSRHLLHFHPEKVDTSVSNEVVNSCTNCGAIFSSMHKLRFHMQRPRDENGRCIDLQTSATIARQKRSQKREGIFPCSHCARRFHLKAQLERHLNTHDARLRPHQCEQCNVRCRSTYELKQHIKVTHLDIKAFECETCGKLFGYKRDLRHHMLFHAEISIECKEPDCGYTCKNEKQLGDHTRHKHVLIPCEYCSESFTRQRLTTHLRNEHRAQIDVELNGIDATSTQQQHQTTAQTITNAPSAQLELLPDNAIQVITLSEQSTADGYQQQFVMPAEQIQQLFNSGTLISTSNS